MRKATSRPSWSRPRRQEPLVCQRQARAVIGGEHIGQGSTRVYGIPGAIYPRRCITPEYSLWHIRYSILARLVSHPHNARRKLADHLDKFILRRNHRLDVLVGLR